MTDYKTFGFTDEQVLIRDNVLGLLQRVLPQSRIAELDAAKADPTDAFRALADDGWLALPFAEEWGGAGASNKDMAVFIEALGYWHYGVRSAYMTTVIYGGGHLKHHASPELRAEMLPKLIAGELRQRTADFKGFERPKSFAIVTEDFTTDNGMLTPTMKLKRRSILAKYQDRIDGLYG